MNLTNRTYLMNRPTETSTGNGRWLTRHWRLSC
jgi:hypothetical protein